MRKICALLSRLLVITSLLVPSIAASDQITRFVGGYEGEAEFLFEGEVQRRDMSTQIEKTESGFSVGWTSVSYKPDGRSRAKTYKIQFSPSARDNIYKSAMKRNLFGKATPLDPLQGEPYVWAYFEADTLTVYSMFINENGGYEVQEFHRTLAEEGLDLVFRRVHNGVPQKEIRTFLTRLD